MSSRFLACLVLLFVVVCCVGCSKGPKTYAVSGSVTAGGQPVKDAAVMFYRKGNVAVSAQTQADGSFQLHAVAGEHQVTVSACEQMGPTLNPTPEGDAAAKLRWIVPQRYSQLDSSDLKAKVEPGKPNQFKFDLPAK